MDDVREKNGLEVLSATACYDYLARCRVGRLAYSRPRSGVCIEPIMYALDLESIFFTFPGSRIDEMAGISDGVVFEIDSAERETTTGWSVIVSGSVREVVDLGVLARLRQLPTRLWVASLGLAWAELRINEVTGRRILP